MMTETSQFDVQVVAHRPPPELTLMSFLDLGYAATSGSKRAPGMEANPSVCCS